MLDLFVIAPHPDDETLYAGGLISAMAAAGKTVATLTLTRGGSGRTLGMCEPVELPAIREAELRAALRTLGVADVTILDLPDGSLIRHRKEVVSAIALSLRRLDPAVIVSFPPNGINGHLDHVITSHAVADALAGLSRSPSLYYFATERPFDGPERPDYLSHGDIRLLHKPPTHRVHARDRGVAKLRALGCHETQARSVARFLREHAEHVLTENFHRVSMGLMAGEPTTLFLPT
jgi:LmbE family N-acetylglucosaminyl deacetylase